MSRETNVVSGVNSMSFTLALCLVSDVGLDNEIIKNRFREQQADREKKEAQADNTDRDARYAWL